MHNFQISFSSSPYWLLLLIPFFAVTFILYFRQAKKYRRRRNVIVSMVLHLIVSTLAVCALAGVYFTYEVDSTENQIILLVDVSDTEEQSQAVRDDFVETVLENGSYDGYKIGVVTFGFNQQYAVPLTFDADSIFDKYLEAELPDTSATDIAAAINYTKTLFDNSGNASRKIVLITDGKQTDETSETTSALRSAALLGIKVDTAYISSSYEEGDVQVTAVEYPDYHMVPNNTYEITVTLQSETEKTVTVELYDNDVLDSESAQTVTLKVGTQTISFDHTFKQTVSASESSSELHRLLVKVTESDPTLEINNEYNSYVYLEVYNHILILENYSGVSTQLQSILQETDSSGSQRYVAEILNFQSDADKIPTTVDGLRAYDQVILNNVSNKNMTDFNEDFVQALYDYVNDYGGGLLTVGGGEEDNPETAHAYERDYMVNSLYQQMLPVEAIDYTPPLGVVIIIDVSGSMTSAGEDGDSKLEWAKSGAIACLEALSERDYVGIMTLDETYGTILPMTSRVEKQKIINAINSVQSGSTTVFSDSLHRAGQMLLAKTNIDKRHIIIVTDGEPTENEESYMSEVSVLKENGISVSIVGVEMASSNTTKMETIVNGAYPGGKVYAIDETSKLLSTMREDLRMPSITEVTYEDFYPIVYNTLSPVLTDVYYAQDTENNYVMPFTLAGFYGTKARSTDYVVLSGEYDVPIYAVWDFGNGKVGSFMCDLSGVWSSEMLSSDSGKQFIWNMVENLMPTENIRPEEIITELEEENYTNKLKVDGGLQSGERLEGKIIEITGDGEIETSLGTVTDDIEGLSCYVTTALSADNLYGSCSFVIKGGGVYKIVITKYDANNEVVASTEFYKSFAYSSEYDVFLEQTDEELAAAVAQFASDGGGECVADLEDPKEIFASFVTGILKTVDPRIAFMIIAMVLFLLDIAVRKFKFKWLHEIIRDRRERKKKT